MEFRVLGPLEANDGTTPLALGGRKQRALLARLVLGVNRAIPMQRLIDDLWGEDVPASATKMVQIYVSQLRKVLPADVLRTQPPGYLVAADPETVDAVRFATLRGEGAAALAAGDVAAASRRLREALDLWRGPPLAEFTDEPFAKVEGAHLEELRLTCLQESLEAELALGRHADAVGELEALVAEHPLREPLHGQLMLALYRSGRQADALAAYERFRRTLDDELGIEPTEPIKQLQFKILNQDSALAPPPSPAHPREAVRVSTGFVGRAAELAELDAAFEDAAAERGGTLLIGGPAGIGKTRLIRELAARADARGATVLEGRCIQLIGSGLPYLPVVDALRPLCGAPQLTELVPDLRELPRLVAGLVDGAPPPSEAETRAQSRVRLFSEVLAVVDRLSGAAVVVLVLEDLHWADESTLDLVAYLAHAVPGRKILFVASYRSDEAGAGERLQAFVTGLAGAPEVATRQLGPLSRDEVAAIVTAGSDDALSEAMSEAILVRAQGNPFFARELLSATTRGQTALPPGLRDVLLAKVARLDPTARQVLRVAAVTGRDVTYGLLAAVVPADELVLAEALRQTVEREVLEPDRSTRAFRFRHALFAEAVYDSLLPGERELLHEQLARALTEEPALAEPGAEAAETAHHWAAAGRPLEALVASLEAAREAEAVSGLTEAMRHVERVLELWDAVPGAEELAGFALPSVLDWAAELGSAELEARINIEEARHLYPTAVVLESLAVRTSPPFGAAALQALHDANARFRAASDDAVAASAADDDFHRVLTERCDNTLLLAALRPVKQALLRYEGLYMRDPERVAASAAQHDAIIEALERGDQAAAAQLVRANLADGLPDLTTAIER